MSSKIHSIAERRDLKGVQVLLRSDLNVPIQNDVVVDSTRLDLSLKTIRFLIEQGARVVLMSHRSDTTASLTPVFDYYKATLPITFLPVVSGLEAQSAAKKLQDGQVLLLENIRFDPREEANDPEFAKELAALGKIFVNDAFSVSHRAHACFVGVPAILPSYAGFQLLEEVEGLTSALVPDKPALAVIGGAKLTTKITLIKSLLQKYDNVFVGGALANDLYVAKGYSVGKSLVSGTDSAHALVENPKIIIPTHVIVSGPAGTREVRFTEVGSEDTILDVAPSSIRELKPFLDASKFVLWNGPMGNFEKGFRQGTDVLAQMIADAPGKKVIGGGDTLSSIQNLGLWKKFTFVSTSGGAMLDFLANGTLPGIEALESSII